MRSLPSILLLLSLILIICTSDLSKKQSTQTYIDYVYKQLNGPSYWDKDQTYSQLKWKWQHMKGIYQSRVHFNVLDKRNSFLTDKIRNDMFKIDDINMFVSSFVLYGLIEAQSLGTIQIDHHKFSQSLEAITQFKDKNIPDGIPQYLFWPQTLVNGTWSAKSVNLINIVNMAPSFPPKWNNWLNKHGLGILTMIKQIGKFFCIPPDNDDSAVNLALLGFMKQTNSPHYSFFNSFNYRKLQFYQRALKYAYRPFETNFAENKRCNQIDPRTYYVLSQFLDSKRKQAEQKNQTASLILPTTWLLNQDQQITNLIFMPFETNNVDATVSSNFLFGLIFQIMTDQIRPEQLSKDLIQMMHNTVDLIEYVIESVTKNNRLDLILVYYPSKYDFYWFVSRTLNLLKRNYDTKLNLNGYEDFKFVYERLRKLLKTHVTENILKNHAQHELKNDKGYYWAEFLGNYGKKQRNDDAIFSTSLALNALFDTWTTKKGNKLTFDEDTPSTVKDAIQKGVKYIEFFIDKQMKSKTGYKMKLSNAFFSGSMKIFKTSFPYFYPANVHYDKNGTNFDPTTMDLKDLTFGSKYYVKGYIEENQYKDLLKKKWFGSEVPTTFTGFNDGVGLTFPYWSSQAISEIMMITSLSKYLKVNQAEKINESQ